MEKRSSNMALYMGRVRRYVIRFTRGGLRVPR